MYDLDERQLDERQEQAIFLLLEGKQISEVAEELGVDRSTVYRWKQNNALFKKVMDKLKRSVWEAGESQLIHARLAAIDTVIELLDHEDARVKLKAIEIILRFDDINFTSGPPILRWSRS
jgi:transposase